MFDGHKDYYPLFYRVSENEKGAMMVIAHSLDDLSELLNEQYIGHHLFSWRNPRKGWFSENVPIHFDFGGNFLYKLERYGESKTFCVRIVSKKFLVDRYGGEYVYTGIPTQLKAIFLQGK